MTAYADARREQRAKRDSAAREQVLALASSMTAKEIAQRVQMPKRRVREILDASKGA